MLLKAGADPNICGNDEIGITPLSVAASTKDDHLEVVRLLVEGGADVNAKDKKGMTPLDWATREGNEAVREFLLNHGAKE